MDSGKKIKVIYGDGHLGLYTDRCTCLFSYSAGGPVSLCIDGHEWLYRAAKPVFWRAVTDNDRGNGFPFRAAVWMGADMFSRCAGIQIKEDGSLISSHLAPANNALAGTRFAREMEIAYSYALPTVPAASTEVTYQMNADGQLTVTAHYFGQPGLPELPVFGMRFIAPTKATGYHYQGLSGETYPDRMAGGIPGIYTVDGLPVTPYMVPQDCGMHMNTDWLEIYRTTSQNNCTDAPCQSCLRVAATDQPFAFSCLPYTAQELENATHHEELPPARRTVLCVYGAVRGVGGIDSWGSDVEEPWHVSGEEDHEFSFMLGSGALPE